MVFCFRIESYWHFLTIYSRAYTIKKNIFHLGWNSFKYRHFASKVKCPCLLSSARNARKPYSHCCRLGERRNRETTHRMSCSNSRWLNKIISTTDVYWRILYWWSVGDNCLTLTFVRSNKEFNVGWIFNSNKR